MRGHQKAICIKPKPAAWPKPAQVKGEIMIYKAFRVSGRGLTASTNSVAGPLLSSQWCRRRAAVARTRLSGVAGPLISFRSGPLTAWRKASLTAHPERTARRAPVCVGPAGSPPGGGGGGGGGSSETAEGGRG